MMILERTRRIGSVEFGRVGSLVDRDIANFQQLVLGQRERLKSGCNFPRFPQYNSLDYVYGVTYVDFSYQHVGRENQHVKLRKLSEPQLMIIYHRLNPN